MIRPILIASLILSMGIVIPDFSLAQGDAARRLRTLQTNGKLNVSSTVLNNLADDGATVRVIVHLRDPQARYGTTQKNGKLRATMLGRPARQLRAASVRRQLRKDVGAMQQQVIAATEVTAARVTNRFNYIFGFSAEFTAEELQSLANHPDVLSIETDKLLEPHLAQGIPLMNASVISDTFNGAGMAIAICDTGIDYTHPMLGGGGFPNAKVIGGYDAGENDADPLDRQGHGTACAGIAAGSLGSHGDYIGGVAYDAKLYALKITSSPSGASAYVSDMVEAWEWCITHQHDDPDNPIMIISTSFGGGSFSDQAACDGAVSAMTAAAANAKAVGITIFVSAGNEGYCDALAWPGCLSDVISVGAVYDDAVGDFLPCVSADSCASKTATNLCSTGYYTRDTTAPDAVASYSNSASFLGLLAPANAAYTTAMGGGYTSYSGGFGGTSAAAPYAAGAAACLQHAAKVRTGAYLTPDALEAYLTDHGNLITDAKSGIATARINLGQAADAIASLSVVTTTEVSQITSNTALGGGSIADDGGAAVIGRGLCWRRSVDTTGNEQCTQDGNGSGSFTNVMTGLLAGTVYQVRAYAVNEVGTAYGEALSFTTLPAPPVVEHTATRSVTDQTGTLTGTINPNGGETEYYFEYGLDERYGEVTAIARIGTQWDGIPVDTALKDLAESTTYHYRLVATNPAGTTIGNGYTFTTLSRSAVASLGANGDGGGGGCFIGVMADGF
ncbi:MAG: S8 family serine peptidase [Desulfatitalea sp.]|nr:S8 family serine peptidase [Desulfatitalea sp.]